MILPRIGSGADRVSVSAARCIESAGSIPLIQHDAETLADDDFAARSASRQFAADQRNACLGRQHVDAGQFHHLGDGAAGGHADAAPCGPVDDDAACVGTSGAEARGDLAQQIVGGAVVGLSAIAEASGNRTERHRRAERHVADGMQQIEPAVALHVEDQIEFTRVLVREEVAALSAGSVQQHIDAPAALAHLLDDFGDSVCIRQVDAEVVCRASGGLHRLDGVQAACARSRAASSFSTSAGVARSPRAWMRANRSRFRPSLSVTKRVRSGFAGSGSGTRSSR